MKSARLLRYASFLSGFDYTVKFKKGEENKNADCLSRVPVPHSNVSTDLLINEECYGDPKEIAGVCHYLTFKRGAGWTPDEIYNHLPSQEVLQGLGTNAKIITKLAMYWSGGKTLTSIAIPIDTPEESKNRRV
ncbi:unnamed protein product [Nezara viridula]|uniref:Uncharacterized protein n=1 Tax=Nezara viridula TaxID=85310 RepID=A0A9P0H586_NEZVI|nr:unnamed protein product [Nezara viridula]